MRNRIAARIFTALVLSWFGLFGGASAARAALVSAVEFYHAGFDHYFITASVTEIALLDAGRFDGWSRTGQEFRVDDVPGQGLVPVCRFFSVSFGLKSSHFYTPFADECAKVRANPDWIFEAEAFYVRLPDAAGNCVAGTTPVFRLYNDGQGGAPNHKYTPSRWTRNNFLTMRWVPEGIGAESVMFCVPAYFDLAQQRTQQMSGGTWEFSFTTGQSYTTRADFGSAEASGDPELPFLAPVTNPVDSGIAGWDPFAGKIVVGLLTGLDVYVFIFDFDGGDVVQGCAFQLADIFDETPGRCYPFTGSRL